MNISGALWHMQKEPSQPSFGFPFKKSIIFWYCKFYQQS
jgi:hypothetical protein